VDEKVLAGFVHSILVFVNYVELDYLEAVGAGKSVFGQVAADDLDLDAAISSPYLSQLHI
jgi:tRNA A37 threonylcarbamoyladenosine biosynthesis protein TsaE